MLNQVDVINEYAYNKYKDLTGVGFEYVLRDVLNLFADVEAEKIGGAGKTDIECLYILPKAKKKFDVEAKSRNRRLSEINPRRLREHREAVKSRYTLIVAPSFASGVKADIEKELAVLIESNVLSQYLYQYICAEAKKDDDNIIISYKDLEEMALDNLGKDMTPILREFIFEKYGHNCAV
jgi:type II restriction enzyme